MLGIIARHRNFIVVLILALALRIVLAWASPGVSYDIDSYQIQAQAVLNGENIYAVTFRYPYLPLWMYWPAIAVRLSEITSLPFYFWVKLLSVGADIGIGWLLWSWSQPREASLRSAALYWFNPVVVMISAMHGQFDAVVIFMVLLAAKLWLGRRLVLASLSFGVGIALKGFPVLLLPAFLIGLASWQQAMAFVLLAGCVPAIISLPYLARSHTRIIQIFLSYNSTADHSYSYLLLTQQPDPAKGVGPTLTLLRQVSRWLELAVVLCLTMMGAVQRWLLEERLVVIILAIYAVAPGLASQQMLWVIPFLILTRYNRSYWIYTVASTVALIFFYAQHFPAAIGLSAGWSGPVLLASRSAIELSWWLTVIIILIWIVSQQQRRRAIVEAADRG